MSWWTAVIGESVRAAVAQRVISVISILIIAAMCASVLLTAGRASGLEREVLQTIDTAGTRAIVVRAQDDAGLNTSVLGRLADVQGISWVGAFGPALDVQNGLIPDGAKVPMREIWASDLRPLSLTGSFSPEGSVGGSPAALRALGMIDGVGSVVTQSGIEYPVVAKIATPVFLLSLDPLLLRPRQATGGETVSILVVIASSPDLVAPISEVVRSVLGVRDPSGVSVQTSEKFAELRGLVQEQLGGFGRNLILLLLGGAALLVGMILYAFVLIRRKDYGRRRALGATRGLIIVLLAVQTGVVSGVGAAAGSVAGSVGILASGDPLPAPSFVASIAILSVAVGVTGALIPALVASRRDPLKELRVP